MLIGMDYDETWTRDVEFWAQVVALGRLRGHRFVCVTSRRDPPGIDEPAIPMPVVCADIEMKRKAATKAGYLVDVWIDDIPEMIGPTVKLAWPDIEPSDAQLSRFGRLLDDDNGLSRLDTLRAAWAYAVGGEP